MVYDFYGNQIIKVYDFYGNLIGSGNTEINVQDFLYRADWTEKAKTAYNMMTAKMDDNSIPFFISTDQHGRYTRVLEPSRVVHNFETVGLANINLGDTVTDYFNYNELNSMKSRANGIANFLPVVGNHDAFTRGADVANNEEVTMYFTPNHEGVVYPSNRVVNYYKVVDSERNVKWLVLCPYYMLADGSRNGVTIETAQMQWLINELQTDDHDIIILMHQLFTDDCVHRDGTKQNWADAPKVLKDLWNVCKARKTGGNGTITDSLGISHSYNFGGMSKKLLCSLHGHSHEELYQADTMTQYVCNWLDQTLHATFGLVDRTNSKLRIWQFDKDSVMEELVLDV